MHRPLPILALLLTFAGCATSQSATRNEADTTPPDAAATEAQASPTASTETPQFETYQLVLLRRDETWQDDPDTDLAALQRAHLAHLTAMGEAGHMVVAGPFGDQDDENLRGLCLYRVGSVEEARALAEADPMVQAGRLRVEVMTWYTEAGYVVFPKAPHRATAPAP